MRRRSASAESPRRISAPKIRAIATRSAIAASTAPHQGSAAAGHGAVSPVSPPSFVIEAAGGAPARLPSLRLDRVNSRDLLAAARQVYFAFLATGAGSEDPLGVVLGGGARGPGRGRVVFSLPVLLPDEEFVALDLLRSRASRAGGGRANAARTRPLRPLPA